MITDGFCKPHEKTHSVYGFIAVCESARFETTPRNHAPRRGAVKMQHRYAAFDGKTFIPQPCAVAHGYKRISAMRLGATQIQSFELFNK